MKFLLPIIIAILTGLGTWENVSAQQLRVGNQSTTVELIEQAKLAFQLNADKLKSAVASGEIQHLFFRYGQELPIVTLDADIQILYDAPKFCVHIQYAKRLQETSAVDPESETPGWLESNLAEQTLLFDGQSITTVERNRNDEKHGDLYFNFHKTTVLRQAGLPFENPVELSTEAFRIDRADLLNATTTSLSGGGFLGVLNKETYRLKFYLFGSFGYDLRRVSSYRLGADVPFRDWHLNWLESHGVYYTNRIISRLDEGSEESNGAVPHYKTRRQIEIEFKSFEANVAVDRANFELSSLDLPVQTRFYDHRVNVNGKPKVLQWNGKALVDAAN